MSDEIDVKALVGRPESPSTLVRFEDETDKHAPRLNYAVPLPGSYEGRFYQEVELGELPWKPEALQGESRVKEVLDGAGGRESLPRRIDRNLNLIYSIGSFPRVTDPLGPISLRTAGTAFGGNPGPGSREAETNNPAKRLAVMEREGEAHIRYLDYDIPVSEIEKEAQLKRALVIYRTFGGSLRHTFVAEGQDKATANPRFVIVEHYRISSHFGDYGAGRTVKTFTLWPGEETTLYVRSWRRTEKRFKEASSIFDSYTQEAADSFEFSLEAESSYRESYQKSKAWKASGGFGLNLGICKIGGGGGGGGSSKSARESFAKSVSKVATHHASQASAKRET